MVLPVWMRNGLTHKSLRVCVCLGGELYTATVADYRGNRPVISRHLSEGDRVDLKLDDTPGWLEG